MPRHITPPVEMVGKQFGWLTVICREGSWVRKGIKKYATWRCVCTCGQQVVVRGYDLRRGKRKGCGIAGHVWARRSRGGLVRSRPLEYGSWKKMWERCRNKKHHKHRHYGGRGITICARWKEFKNFLEDMGPRPSRQHSIERKDNDGNYEPGNCCWATAAEQARNTSRSVFVEYEGERMLLVDLCAKLGVKRGIMYGRLKNGWSLENALFTPVKHYDKKKCK